MCCLQKTLAPVRTVSSPSDLQQACTGWDGLVQARAEDKRIGWWQKSFNNNYDLDKYCIAMAIDRRHEDARLR